MKKIIGLILVFFMILINMYIGFNIVYALGVSSEIKNNGFVELLQDEKYPTIENKLEFLEKFFKQNLYDSLTDEDKNEIKFTEQECNSMLKHVMAMTLYNFLNTWTGSELDTNAKDIIEKWENKKDKTKLINGIIRIFIDCFENTDLLNILKQDEVMELLNKLIDKKDEDFEKETIDLIKKSEKKNHNYKVCIFRLFNKQIINKDKDKEINKFLSDNTFILNIIYDSNFENDIDTILQNKLTERKEKVENEYNEYKDKDKNKDLIKKLCPIVQNFTDNGKQEFLNKKENELVASLLSNDKDVKQSAMEAIAKIILSIKDNTIKQKVLDGTIVIKLKKQIIDQINSHDLRSRVFLEFMEQLGDIVFKNKEIFDQIIDKTYDFTWDNKDFLKFIEKFKFNGKDIFTDKEILKQIINGESWFVWDRRNFLRFIKRFKIIVNNKEINLFDDKEILKCVINKLYSLDLNEPKSHHLNFILKFEKVIKVNGEEILNEIEQKLYKNSKDFKKFKKALNYKVYRVYRRIINFNRRIINFNLGIIDFNLGIINFNLATGITRLENNTVYVKNPFNNNKEIFITYTIEETNLSFEKLVSKTKTKLIGDNDNNKTILAELMALELANKKKYDKNSWTREYGYQESIKNNWNNLNEKTKEILKQDLEKAVKNDPVIETIDVVFDKIGTKKENIIIEKLFSDVKTLLESANQDLILEINKEKISIKEVKELLDRKETWNKQDKEKIKHIFKLFSKIGLQTAINSMPEELNISINDPYVEGLSKIDVFANIGRAIRSAA